MRSLVGVVAVLAVLLASGCTEEAPDASVDPSSSSSTSSTPEPLRVEVGLYHCGVLALHVEGEQWIPVGVDFDATNAPYYETFSGAGTFDVTDPDRAVYVDDLGERIEFRRDDRDWPPPDEGCY